MKRNILILGIFCSFFFTSCKEKAHNTTQTLPETTQQNQLEDSPNTIGMIIYSNDEETVWNALRLANYAQNNGNTVSVFLLGKGVELDDMVKTSQDLAEQVDSFLDNKGTILGCGTCLESRKKDGVKICTFSSISDLYDIINQNDKILTF